MGGCGDEGDSGWGYVQGTSGCSGGIDRRDIGSGNVLDDGRSDKLGGNAGEWTGGELASYLRSTKTLLVGGYILCQTSTEKRRPRCWKRRCGWIGR